MRMYCITVAHSHAWAWASVDGWSGDAELVVDGEVLQLHTEGHALVGVHTGGIII